MLALVPTRDMNDPVKIGERPDPTPTKDEVLVKVDVFSLNRADFLYLSMPNTQWRVGIDFAGTVVQSDANGKGPTIGTRVLAHCPAGGGGAALATVPVRLAIPLPDGFDTAVAAGLPLAGLTALRLIREAHLTAGQHVLITGATGGVGPIAIELAIRAGAKVTALVRRPAAAQRLRDLGAAVVSSLDDVPEPFDVVLESVGGTVMAEAIKKLRRRGLVLWFGQASGQPVTLDFFSLLGGRESISLRHFVYSDVTDADDAGDLTTLVRLVADGGLHPEPISVRNWAETGEALKKIKSGKLEGKAVFTVGR